MTEGYLTLKDLMKLLGVGRHFLRVLDEDPEIPTYIVTKNRWKAFSVNDLPRIIEKAFPILARHEFQINCPGCAIPLKLNIKDMILRSLIDY